MNLANLCVASYKEYCDGIQLHEEVAKQYHLDDDDLKHLVLSPKAHVDAVVYECCEICFRGFLASKKDGVEIHQNLQLQMDLLLLAYPKQNNSQIEMVK